MSLALSKETSLADRSTVLQWMKAAGIAHVEISDLEGDRRIAFSNVEPAPAPLVRVLIRAPIAGVLLTRHPWRDERFTEVQSEVIAGEILAVVRIGTIYVPVTAPSDGRIAEILVPAETIVEYGTSLMVLDVLRSG